MGDSSYCGCCGFYCGSCPIHIAYKKGIDFQRKLASALSVHMKRAVTVTEIQCQGCRSAAGDRDSWAHKCKLRDCAAKKGKQYCIDCGEFPCDSLMDLSEAYHNVPITQLHELKELGSEKWLEKMAERWKCSKCTGAVEASTKKCGTCNSDCSRHVEESIDSGRKAQ